MADAEMLSPATNDDLLDLFDPSTFLFDTDSSSENNSPPLISDDSTPDASPSHWSHNFLEVDLLPLPDISIDVNTNDLSLYNPLDTPLNTISTNSPQTVPTLIPSTTAASDTSIIKKQVTRSKKRARVAEPLPSPTGPDAQVALPRDQLLSISSKSMDQYVETLSSTRSLSMDEQKELKKQKRLIKNRESAQLSRERKRAYINQLEDKIQLLVMENNQLKDENLGLRQALSHYQVVPPSMATTSSSVSTIKSEPAVDYASKKIDPIQQHQTKMGGLLSIGGNKSATAKAGVCLLIVFFTFGLFMNAANNSGSNSSVSRLFSVPKTREALPDVPFTEREIVRLGYKRTMLEAFPEVLDEDNDDYNDISVRQLPEKVSASESPSPAPHRHIHPIEVQSAGIFKVSYSTKPAQFLPVGNEKDTPHEHDSDNGNRTYMLFLDPRPDLVDQHEPDVDTTSSTGLVPMKSPSLPPMIISLVVPKDIGKNGSFPLLPNEGVRAEDSLVEITCQVLDVSITTTETTIRP